MKEGQARAVAWAGAVAALAAARPASGGLRESIGQVAQAWRDAGATVVVDGTRFLNEGETAAIVLPDLPAEGCSTVALLGARGLGFHVRVPDAEEGDHGARIASQAGALSIERCGGPPLRGVLVTSDSGRGALEVAIARSAGPLAPLRGILPDRVGGTWAPGPEPGPQPTLPSPERRAEVAEARARRDGAAIGARTTLRAGLDGSGGGEATLEAGCHTLRLFPVDPRASRAASRGKVDLDAEVRGREGDMLLARDRSDAPDAELSACIGERTQADVLFVGSTPGAPVLVSHYAWPLPDHLPAVWGNEVRARMARVLLARHVVSLPREPFFLAQGGSGATPVPFAIEPGGCYLALVSAVQGAARTLGLRVRVAARDAFDDRGIEGAGAAVAFCAGEREGAIAVVDAHGAPPLGWALAVYRIADGAWQVPE
jgi:hypothetical protein